MTSTKADAKELVDHFDFVFFASFFAPSRLRGRFPFAASRAVFPACFAVNPEFSGTTLPPPGKMDVQRRRSAFTMVEMLVTVAGLIILLGLMVSLARYVRERAAVALTKELLRQLDDLTTQYAQRNNGQLPSVAPFPPPVPPPASNSGKQASEGWDENNPAQRRALLEAALENNRRFVAVLKAESGSTATLNNLPLSMYNDVVLRDAWGSPIVFMPSKHPLVGTAPNNRYFFFSAGSDRLYLTQDDNLYSYEDLSLEQLGVVRR